MRQYKGGELRKKKFSEVASGSLCQMLLRDQVGWTETRWSLKLAPVHPGRSQAGAVFSWVRTAVRLRRDEKRKGGEVMEWVSIDISSQKCCCKREQRMMYLEGYVDVGSSVRHYWQNGGTALNPLPLFRRHGPGMKELGFVILTCFFLSSAELTEENIKVLFLRGAWEGIKPSAAVLKE